MGRTRWRLLAAAGALLLLTGCVPEDEPAPAPTESTPEPTFSDEELLAKASETLDGYFAALAELHASESPDYTTLLPFATPELATSEVASIQSLHDQGVQALGTFEATNLALLGADGVDSTFVGCFESGNVSYVDAEGNEVVFDGVEDRFAATFTFQSGPDGTLLLSNQAPFEEEGANPCG